LHVVDIADPGWQNHIHVVNKILTDLEVATPILYVFNKADKIDTQLLAGALENYEPRVIISSLSKKKIEPLIEYLNSWMPQ
jgi:50S ribosomal subunit-associated GTPase HflX